jgi:hypothetical protein
MLSAKHIGGGGGELRAPPWPQQRNSATLTQGLAADYAAGSSRRLIGPFQRGLACDCMVTRPAWLGRDKSPSTVHHRRGLCRLRSSSTDYCEPQKRTHATRSSGPRVRSAPPRNRAWQLGRIWCRSWSRCLTTFSVIQRRFLQQSTQVALRNALCAPSAHHRRDIREARRGLFSRTTRALINAQPKC